MKIKKIAKAYSIYKNSNKKFLLQTMREVYRQFGFRGLKIAISNKLNKRPLLANLNHEENHVITEDTIDYDRIGNEIFLKQQNEYSKEDILSIIGDFEMKPLISVIMPIYNPPIKWLVKAIESLQNQYYDNWELCAVDDGSKDGRAVSIIEKIAENDPRIKIIRAESNGGISAASNISLNMCKGEYVALMDQDDEITHDAFFWIAKTINENMNVEFMYTDECKIDVSNNYNRSDFFFKPDWSPTFLINCMYSGHLTVYKTDLIRQIGGFRSKFDFSQDYDLALRMSGTVKNVIHIERVLYYWRTLPTSGAAGGKDYARISNMAALHDWYKRNGLDVIMEKRDRANYGRIKLKSNPKVSIIIPTDSFENLKDSIQGLLTKTNYANIEIIPVTNSKVAEEILSEYPYLDNLNICYYNKVYNFSDKCNEGANIATGDILIFYNDDVIPYTSDWIEKQIELLEYPGVGGVSPLLLYENKTIQYAGMITGTPGIIGTSFNGRHIMDPVKNPFNHFLLRDVSILSGAVAVIKKDVFLEVGGFDEINTPNGQSDLDLSLKLIEKNYRCVYTPYAILTHIGNHSWAEKEKADKADIYCLKKWGKYLGRDMYFTDSMKKMFYGDFGYNYRMYFPEDLKVQAKENGKDILFISHELTRTGAPVVLKDMVRVALDRGDFPVVLCPVDGPLKNEFLEMGVIVIIDESLITEHWMFDHLARNFDLVVVNTLACSKAINLLSNSLPSVLWWVHEGSYAIDSLRNYIPNKVGKNIKVVCAGKYALEHFNKLNLNCKADVLNFGVSDKKIVEFQKAKNDKVRFLLVGTYEKRKGQDILVKAINLLEKKYMEKSEFIFIGNALEKDIYNEVKKLADQNENVKVYETLARNEVYNIYQESTCVISPSRDDPTPIVMIEAMMMSKICICSDNTGASRYIQNGKSGFVFRNKDVKDLAEKISYVIENNEHLDNIRIEGRKIYDEHFEMKYFDKKVNDIFKNIFDNK
ncbi:glycosyltransferase [uncultured Clostridium sp.]|uniref:glycosyltransferase n=1 Tax=uncultured Clostridium sp. TaxID=59620 RepID=UPI0028EAC2B8|nr:glycosyltransferase [uncultured Clostridium sp.]